MTIDRKERLTLLIKMWAILKSIREVFRYFRKSKDS